VQKAREDGGHGRHEPKCREEPHEGQRADPYQSDEEPVEDETEVQGPEQEAASACGRLASRVVRQVPDPDRERNEAYERKNQRVERWIRKRQ
jgi:hypothetical protein